MLKYLKLENVGPAAKMELDLAPRLNIITGDNGLGKSFLLDVAWFVYTHRWPAEVNPKLISGLKLITESEDASIQAVTSHGERSFHLTPPSRAWISYDGVYNQAQLVVYLMADGSCSIFDPYRNVPQSEEEMDTLPEAFIFSSYEIFHGLQHLEDTKISLCEGLVRDWASWQKEKGGSFVALNKVLESLSPEADFPIKAGKLTRISVRDSKDMPTINFGEQENVAIVHASSSMKRIVSFAYLLVWTWQEHLRAAKFRRAEPLRDILFLVDEVDAHLHPSWQRKIVPTLLGVVDAFLQGMVLDGLNDDEWTLEKVKEMKGNMNVQLIATTHSPLVMASLEPHFDAEKDAWFDLDLVRDNGSKPEVVLTKRPFEKMGSANGWLVSEAFDLESPFNIPHSEAIKEASAALRDENFNVEDARILDRKIQALIDPKDPFWTKWRMLGKQKGWWQ